MAERGKFIVVDGGVGCGKTTILSLLSNNILTGNWVFFREPGGTSFGEIVRNAVQGNNDYFVHPYAELFAYMSARANLIRGRVEQHLKEKDNVGLDRYWYSTFAYQGARGISKPLIMFLGLIATRGLKPDLILHYDLAPEIGMKRKFASSYTSEIDRLDLEDLPFHNRVRRNYNQLRYLFPGSWEKIDASGTIEEVFNLSVTALRKHNII